MKNKLAFIALIIFQWNVYSQDWRFFNDTLVYYYQASHSDQFFTVRAKEKILLDDSNYKVFFSDNIIPTDSALSSFTGLNRYYRYLRGSIFGDSLSIYSDSIVSDENVFFQLNYEVDEPKPFNISLGTEITLVSSTDTTLFGTPDSVRYYSISNGTTLIQSKKYGVISYPNQFSDSLFNYQLVGIENLVGIDFNFHNEIFDFEIGDVFVYEVEYDDWSDGTVGEITDINRLEVINRFIINGLNYYSVSSEGVSEGAYSIYPPILDENSLFDYPGEQLIYLRADDISTNYLVDFFLDEGIIKDRIKLGHNYVINEEGNLVQTIGLSGLKDTYTTFGYYEDIESKYRVNFSELLSHPDILQKSISTQLMATYEAGFGLNHFRWDGHEQVVTKHLIGAIKSGIEMGNFSAGTEVLNTTEVQLYPNPSKNSINFSDPVIQLLIIDMSGKTIYKSNDSVNEIDVSQLKEGVYIIKGLNLLGENFQSKFIKK